MKKTLYMFVTIAVLAGITIGCAPDEPDPVTQPDLDTTYYPFGAGYKWVYEEIVLEYHDGVLMDSTYQTYYVEVDDSTGTDSTCTFKLTGYFDDLPTMVGIDWDSTYVSLEGYPGKPGKTISVVSPQTDTMIDLFNMFCVEYAGDTLILNLRYGTDVEDEVGVRTVKRVKEFGTISQSFSFSSPPDSQYTYDRTLFLVKDADTLWP